MNRQNLLQQVTGIALSLLLLAGCGAPVAEPTPVSPTLTPTPVPPTATPRPSPVPPTATPTPVPALSGTLQPWEDDTPIAGRQIVLCKIVGDTQEFPADCVLMESATTSDDQGMFQIYEVPPGEYYIFYDSGLSDFDAGLEQWGGQTFDLDDREWVNEYLGDAIDEEGWVAMHLPEGISLTAENLDWVLAYCEATLLLGRSPFILAHDIEQAQQHQILNPAIVDVTAGEASQVEFQVVYFGTQ